LLAERRSAIAEHLRMPAGLLDALGAVPSYYLRYFYLHDAVVEEQRRTRTRAEQVSELEELLLERYRDPAVDEKPALLEQRGGAYYSEAALQLIGSLWKGTGDVQVVDVRNDGVVPGLPDDAVVEVPCRVDRAGAVPVAPVVLPPSQQGLVSHVAAYE